MKRVVTALSITLVLSLSRSVRAEETCPAPPADVTCGGTCGTLSRGLASPLPETGTMSAPNCGADVSVGTVLTGSVAGQTRYACLMAPLTTSESCASLPLVVYLHPSLFTPDTLFVTNLPESVDTADVKPGCPGFVLLAPQGRNTEHFYPVPDDTGPGWDNWYRSEDNVDVQTIDHFINEILTGATGVQTKDGKPVTIDPNRIYLTGWSNGSAMAIWYGHIRSTPTETRPWTIAATGVYSAPNPYGDFNDPCPVVDFSPTNSLPKISGIPTMPMLHIHNDCDIAGICQSGQRMAEVLVNSGAQWDDQLINTALQPSQSCVDLCARNQFYGDNGVQENSAGVGVDVTLGTVNHSRWPQTWTASLIRFFQLHPRS